MALTTCRECGEQISTEAKTCPSCGIKSPERKPIGCLTGLAVAFGVVLFVAALDSFIPKTPEEQSQARAATEANDPCKTTDKQRYAAGGLIRANGFRCATIKQMCFFPNLQEYLVTCERYLFRLEDHGGKWSVTPVDLP
jgi:hypothetical protein